MQIGEVIRKYRINKSITQEEMAKRLGVTPPAVNKWENGKSFPDILLLAPIARLLGINVDTLLSFESDLTTTEVNNIIEELNNRFKLQDYDEVFQWAKKITEKYPNCEQLIWQIGAILDARCMFSGVNESKKYDEYIRDCYVRALNSSEESIRNSAADLLFSFYKRKQQYEKAEEYLQYFSMQNPERKRKQAEIYEKTGRKEEAYTAYEELLFSGYQMLSMVFHNLYLLAMQDENKSKACLLLEKNSGLSKIFEMGRYHEISYELDFATAKKDVERTMEIMREMLECVDTLQNFKNSMLYEHMQFKESNSVFMEELKVNLMKCFSDEDTYGYMQENEEWKKMIE